MFSEVICHFICVLFQCEALRYFGVIVLEFNTYCWVIDTHVQDMSFYTYLKDHLGGIVCLIWIIV